jgi:hypothetical protein
LKIYPTSKAYRMLASYCSDVGGQVDLPNGRCLRAEQLKNEAKKLAGEERQERR